MELKTSKTIKDTGTAKTYASQSFATFGNHVFIIEKMRVAKNQTPTIEISVIIL